MAEFGTRLWSFDVSSNKLDDIFMNDLTNFSLPTRSIIKIRAPRHFDVEGKIRPLVDDCGNPVGDYYFIDESAWSATFTCPDRYLADTPVYSAQYADGADTERTSRLRTRSNGRGRPRGDSAAEITRVLAGGAGEPIPDPPHLRYSPHWPPREVGATHLHLNDLKISAPALERLLRLSPGFIEHFECDGPVCLTNEPLELGRKAPWLSKSAFLRGVPGLAYLFRPVISSNLRVLKIHHSLVTNVPTVVSHDGDVLAKFWLAETILREKVDLAHPQTYVPDMNPRLYSLTLCMIPRYSTGVVTERLVNFLKLAAKQEQMIEKVKATMPPRGPPVLEGLRHICLEFEPDTDDELVSLENDDDDDDGPNAGALLSQGPEAFSFFGESAWDAPSSPANSKPTARRGPAAPAHTNPPAPSPTPEDLSSCYPFSRSEGEHVTISHEVAGAHGRGQALTLPVWVGPGTVRPANAPAVNEYMRALSRDPASSASGGVVAATPCHVAAGVPAGELIFRRAWDMMMLLSPATTASTAIIGGGGGGGGGGGVVEKTITPPGRAALRSGVMRDVLVEIKGFRRRAGGVYGQMEAERRERGGVWVEGEHEYWRGKLTVEVPQGRAQSSEYWR
ncbi:hypothetical protein SLS53_002122 [Cytospora paraplurivora]|uniref:Uncharacterized protein n=1 Tax=Cytospora paraplurivora TaxID=2898453 RepID=A0AAN9UEU5_9PEZI